MNIPVRVGSMIAGPPTPLLVMPLNQSHGNHGDKHVPIRPAPPNTCKSDSILKSIAPKTVQSSSENVDTEVISPDSTGPLNSDGTKQPTAPVVDPASPDKTNNLTTSSNSPPTESQRGRCSGLIMPPNNAIAPVSTVASSTLDNIPSSIPSHGVVNASTSLDPCDNVNKSHVHCDNVNISHVECDNVNISSKPILQLVKPPQSSIISANEPAKPTTKVIHHDEASGSRRISTTHPNISSHSKVEVRQQSREPDASFSPENSKNPGESESVSTLEEINAIRSMLKDVNKMINDTSSLVGKIAERVAKLESKLQDK